MVATIGLSEVLLALTALPFIRPNNLYKPVPVPFDLSFTVGTVLITPSEVLTLIVAPLVVIALAVAVRWTPWGLSMRAMSENADSARLSGVWVRRTSTLTWIVAGALSAFNAILQAPGQTSALTQAVSPDLLLFALTAALVGAMVNLTVAFVAGIGVGVLYEVLQWNFLSAQNSTAKLELVFFVVLLAVMLIRVRRAAQDQPFQLELDLAAGRGHRPRLGRQAAAAGVDHRDLAGRRPWRCSCPSSSTSAGTTSSPRSASSPSSPCRSPCSPVGPGRCRWGSSAWWPSARSWRPTWATRFPSRSCCSSPER